MREEQMQSGSSFCLGCLMLAQKKGCEMQPFNMIVLKNYSATTSKAISAETSL